MDNVSSGTAVPTKKRALPLVIVLITAVLAGLVMLYAAVANGYEGGSYSPMLKPVSVEKQLEPGTESSGDTLFDFELIVSPQYIDDKLNQIDKGDSRVESVTGIVYDVTDKAQPKPVDAIVDEATGTAQINGMKAAEDYDGNLIPGGVTLGITDHKINFSLKAGQRILFENMPFAHDDTDCGFIVNELIGFDSKAAKAGYDYSKVDVATEGAEYAPPEDVSEDYGSKLKDTGTTAKAVYGEYKEYLYDEQGNCIYAYYDANGNVVANPNCDKDSYRYVDLYYDADGNEVANPNCKRGDRTKYIHAWFDGDGKRMSAEPTGPEYNPDNHWNTVYVNKKVVEYGVGNSDADWYFNISQNGNWVYYDFDGNVVKNPNTYSGETSGEGYIVDNKLIAVNPGINVFVDENGEEIPLNWSKIEESVKRYYNEDGNPVEPNWSEYGQAYATHATEVIFFNKKVLDPRPLKIAKSVEKSADDAKDDPTAVFNFELIASPGFGDQAPYKGRKVSGKLVDAAGNAVTSEYTFDENHAITFSLHAGESIEFADMPFAADDEKGTYIIKELSYDVKEGTEEQSAASYKFGNVSSDKGTCIVTKAGDPHHDSNALGTADGTLGANGLTTVTVTNRQVTPPSQEAPVDGSAKVTISKILDGADDPDATFDFEMIISPEWATPEYYIGTTPNPVSITGTVYNKSDGKEIGSKTYNIVQNKVTGIELKADQYITFTDVPYKHVEGEPGAVIVNELLDGAVAKTYSLQGYVVDAGKDLGFGQATQDTIVNTDNTPVSNLLAPSGATDKTATGVYGELALDESGNGEFGVTFTNAPAGSKLTVTKNLEGFDFGKYDEANVAFNVYRFDTEADCVAFVRNGNAQNATWRGTLAMHLTVNGVQSTELTGLDEGYYAIEELSATNMKVVDIARKHVHVTAGVGGEFTVSFDNTFDDQNTYENAIVNSYKKIIDKDGKITWQRYKDGEPVTD